VIGKKVTQFLVKVAQFFEIVAKTVANPKKCQNINPHSQFESPKDPHQLRF
jgi:hypothetical protein